jgi:hypothetical protein
MNQARGHSKGRLHAEADLTLCPPLRLGVRPVQHSGFEAISTRTPPQEPWWFGHGRLPTSSSRRLAQDVLAFKAVGVVNSDLAGNS